MVSGWSIAAMLFSAIVPLGFFVFLLVRCLAHYKTGIKPVLIGDGMFLLFALVLEQILHYFILKQNPVTAAFFSNSLAYAIYGALAAGIFEETGRLIGYRFLLKRPGNWEQGLAYGMGHGGLELIVLGGTIAVSEVYSLYYSFLINSGKFGRLLKAAEGIPLKVSGLETLRQQLTQYPSWEFLMSGIERVSALFIQLALSLLVMYAVSRRKYVFYFLAILAHAVVDFTAVFLSGKGVSPLILEGILLFYALLALAFVIFTKKKFYKPHTAVAKKLEHPNPIT